jgi:hypothetical protein
MGLRILLQTFRSYGAGHDARNWAGGFYRAWLQTFRSSYGAGHDAPKGAGHDAPKGAGHVAPGRAVLAP